MAISFGVKMDDKVSAPAGSAAHQVSILSKQMTSLKTAMVKANAVGDAKAFNRAADAFQKVGTHVDALKSSMPKVAAGTNDATSAMGMMTAELGAIAAGAAVAAGAVMGLVAALAMGAKFAIEEADTNRQLKTTFEALGAGGQSTLDMLGKLEDSLPFSKEQLGAWGKSLAEQGIKGAALEKGVRAAASAVALMGDEAAGAKVSSLISALARGEMTGKSVKDIGKALRGVGVNAGEVGEALGVDAKRLQAMVKSGQGLDKIGDAIESALLKKGKGALVEYGKSWHAMSETAKKAIGNIFEGVGDTAGFKEFVASLQVILNLLGQTSTTGRAAQAGVTASFGALFGIMAKVITATTIMGLNFATSMLRAYIFLFPLIHGFAKLWRAADGSLALIGALKVLKVVLWGAAIATGIVLAPILLLGAAFYAVAFAIAWAVGWIVKKWDTMTKWAGGLVTWFKDLGSNIMDAMAEGIGLRSVALGKAITDGMNAVKKAAEGKLEVHSPSRVFMRIGANVGEGMALGMESAQPRIAASSAKMSGATVPQSGPRSGGAQSRSMTLNIHPGAIQIDGAGKNASDIADEAISLIIERFGLTQGLAAGTS